MARILVIDDEADMRTMLEQMLKAAGHEVVLAENGGEGIDHYRARPADLVITDLVMPKQEGLETIVKLRKEFPGAMIMAMSGNTAASALLSVAKRLGAVSLLQKPFPPDRFMTAVEQALGSGSRRV